MFVFSPWGGRGVNRQKHRSAFLFHPLSPQGGDWSRYIKSFLLNKNAFPHGVTLTPFTEPTSAHPFTINQCLCSPPGEVEGHNWQKHRTEFPLSPGWVKSYDDYPTHQHHTQTVSSYRRGRRQCVLPVLLIRHFSSRPRCLCGKSCLNLDFFLKSLFLPPAF